AIGPLLQVFTSEPGGHISAGQPVALGVLVSSGSAVARVELYDEKVLYSSTPVLNPPPRTVSAVLSWTTERTGIHHLRVVAYDAAGNQNDAAELTMEVVNDNRRPSASFTNYIGETALEVGGPLLLQGVATDDVAISRVDLYVDDLFYTFVAPDKPGGITPFAFKLMWVADTPGVHRLYLRAHDNAGQTDDSPLLLVNATASQPPALAATFERDEVIVGGTLIVNSLALSPNGITRVELLADDTVVDQASSSAAEGQAVFDAPLVWLAPATAGDHVLEVRAIDQSGSLTTGSPHTIHVRPAGTLLATPTSASARILLTPTRTSPKSTATPQVLVPPPPSIALETAEDRTKLALPGPLHVKLESRGSAELDYVELWGYFEGESTPRLLFTDSVKGSTDKTLTFDWLPPHVGVAYLYARVVDRLGQVGKTDLLPVYVLAQPVPTQTPAPFSLTARWTATIPTAQWTVVFVQTGRALRGTLVNQPVTGTANAGLITQGALARDRLGFTVDFPAGAVPRTLIFDCAYSSAPEQLTCNYQDESGNRGSAILLPVK
ncbi:MAG: hypothetical protein ACM3JD_13595, partial [Rudaea sp.]